MVEWMESVGVEKFEASERGKDERLGGGREMVLIELVRGVCNCSSRAYAGEIEVEREKGDSVVSSGCVFSW